MFFAKQSTAIAHISLGPFLDETDGKTAETALTLTQPDIRLSKNGAAFAQKSAAQTLSHMENGYYDLALSATDTDTVGMLRVHVHESGALPVWLDLQVVEEAIYDAMFGASAVGELQVDVRKFGGSALTQSGGRPEVNVTHAAGTAWGSGAITAASIATDAITSAKIAADAIGASELAADAATEIATAVWANGTRNLTALGFTLAASDLAADTITAAKIAADAIGASELATDAVSEIVSAVWAAAARTLTANTNLNDLSAAGVRSALGLASANLDSQLDALPTAVEVVAAVLAAAYEGTESVQDFMRLARAALYGLADGAGTSTMHFYAEDEATPRITATVDNDGNRSAVTLDPDS